MRQWRALVLVGCLAGCAHARAHRPGDEHLTGVDFEGNKRLSRSTLKEESED